MDFEAIKKSAAAYGPDMTRFLRDKDRHKNNPKLKA